MAAVNVEIFRLLTLLVSTEGRGEFPEGFGHSKKGASVPYLPTERPPGAWTRAGLSLRDLKTVTIGDLPARFDWSIMGCTILLRALMNLQRVGGGRMEGRIARGRRREKEGEETKTQKHSQSFTQNKIKGGKKC